MVKWTKEFSAKYETPHKLKHEVLKPSILKALRNIKNKQIADFGCGSGYFSRILAKKGAIVTAIDRSEEQIKIAMSNDRKNITYIKSEIYKTKLNDEQFDIALVNLVLIEAKSSNEFKRIIKECYRTLRHGGMLVIGATHPTNIGRGSKIVNIYPTHNKTYFDNGVKCQIVCYLANGSTMEFYPNYHYTLEFYINTLIDTGFSIKRFIEPKCNENFPVAVVIVAEK